MNFTLGGFLTWSIFARPLGLEFGWTRAQVASVLDIGNVAFGLTFLLGARLQDKRGPRWASVIGGVLYGTGFFLSAWTTTLPWLLFWLGAVAGAGQGFGCAAPIPVMAKWLPHRRGLAVGLAIASYGVGSAIFGPLALNWLIPSYGWRATFQILGVSFFIMTMVGAFLMKNPPVEYRLEGSTRNSVTAGTIATAYEFTPAELLQTPTFYLMWLAYALFAIASAAALSQIVPYARSAGMAGLAATAIFISALGNASGVIFSGWLSDALGRLKALRLAIAISAVAIALLFHTGPNVALFFLLVFVVSYCYGSQHPVNAAAAADFWGTNHLGVNYYLLFTASAGGGILDKGIASMPYQIVPYIAPVMAVIALVCELLARPPRVRAAPERSAEASA
jgi:MFS transporter, OFA family, oxalate/formate antiporter